MVPSPSSPWREVSLAHEMGFADSHQSQVLRGSINATVSQLVTVLEPTLRCALGVGCWQLISPSKGPSVSGRVEVVQHLEDGQTFVEPTVLLVESIGGDEDIPEVSWVLSRQAPVAVVSCSRKELGVCSHHELGLCSHQELGSCSHKSSFAAGRKPTAHGMSKGLGKAGFQRNPTEA